jgi:hypothetical protein
MLFRGRQPESSIWRRFRSGADDFTFVEEEDHYAARVVANAERVVDLLHALAEHLPPAVDVAMEDARSATRWNGVALPLPDVRDAVGRLKVPLAAYGGVEVAIYSDEDQLTLTQDLELYIYARTDRWLYILQGKGLHETHALRPEAWTVARDDLEPAPDLVAAVNAAAQRLGLERA